MNSDEFLELKKKILYDPMIDTFFDEKGNIDFVGIAKYLNKSKEFKDF